MRQACLGKNFLPPTILRTSQQSEYLPRLFTLGKCEAVERVSELKA
jgi:hypothetical protein